MVGSIWNSTLRSQTGYRGLVPHPGAFRVSDRSDTPQGGNPPEEYSGERDPGDLSRGHAHPSTPFGKTGTINLALDFPQTFEQV